MTAGQPPVQDETAGPGAHGPLPFDTSVAQHARMYDYLLGGCFL